MKKIISIIVITGIFTACQTNEKGSLEIKKEPVPLDTIGMYKSNANADTAKISQQNISSRQKTITTTTTQQNIPPKVIYKTRTIVHNNTRYLPAPHQTTPNNNNNGGTAPVPAITPGTNNGTSTNGTSANGNGNSTVGKTTANNGGIVPTQPVPDRKKGWSDAAKDATIGGVGGAIGGAVISKNKGKGAVIGGILGAAGGYILGRKKDKANGRDTIK